MALQDLCNFQDVFLENAAKKDASVLLRRGQNGGFLSGGAGASPFCFQIPVTDYLDESPIQFGQIPQSPVQGSAADTALDSFSLPGLHGFDNGTTSSSPSAPLPFPMAHGTTTLAFIFQGGVLAAADTRSSCAGLVACPAARKIIPIHSHLVGTTSGTSADCALWKRILARELRLYQLRHGRRLTTAGAAKLLSHMLHPFKGTELCVAATLCGWDGGEEVADGHRGGDSAGGSSERENQGCIKKPRAGDGSETEVSPSPASSATDHRGGGGGPSLYYVCSDGTRLQGQLFSVGSGSPYAYSVLDGSVRWGLTDQEAVSLGREAVYRATRRDAYSGNCVDVYHVTAKGWTRRPREDLKEEFYREQRERGAAVVRRSR